MLCDSLRYGVVHAMALANTLSIALSKVLLTIHMLTIITKPKGKYDETIISIRLLIPVVEWFNVKQTHIGKIINVITY